MKPFDEQCTGCEYHEVEEEDRKEEGHCYMFKEKQTGCRLNKNPTHKIEEAGEIARLIIRKGNCDGLSCSGKAYPCINEGTPCPLAVEPKAQSCGWADRDYMKMISLADRWIQEHEPEQTVDVEEQLLKNQRGISTESKERQGQELLDIIKQTEESKSIVSESKTSEETQTPDSKAKPPNDKCDKKPMNEIDILLQIIKTGRCAGIHCDGVDVEPWVENTGTPCPLQESGCPTYKNRNKTNPDHQLDKEDMVVLAKKELPELADIKTRKDVAEFISRYGCRVIPCSGIVEAEGEFHIGTGVECPMYVGCPVVEFGVSETDPSIKEAARIVKC